MYALVIFTVIIAAWSVEAVPLRRLDIFNPRETSYWNAQGNEENKIIFGVPKNVNIDDVIKLNIKLMNNYKRFNINMYGATTEGLPDVAETLLHLTFDFEKKQIYYKNQNEKKYIAEVCVEEIVIKDNIVALSLKMEEGYISPYIFGLSMDSLSFERDSLNKIGYLQVSGHVEKVNSLDFHYEKA